MQNLGRSRPPSYTKQAAHTQLNDDDSNDLNAAEAYLGKHGVYKSGSPTRFLLSDGSVSWYSGIQCIYTIHGRVLSRMAWTPPTVCDTGEKADVPKAGIDLVMLMMMLFVMMVTSSVKHQAGRHCFIILTSLYFLYCGFKPNLVWNTSLDSSPFLL